MKTKKVFLFLAMTLFAASAYGGPQVEEATFAGGCFWCMEPAFEKIDGVISVTVGYTGGAKANPKRSIGPANRFRQPYPRQSDEARTGSQVTPRATPYQSASGARYARTSRWA